MAFSSAVCREFLMTSLLRAGEGAPASVRYHVTISRKSRGEVVSADVAEDSGGVDPSVARGLDNLRRGHYLLFGDEALAKRIGGANGPLIEKTFISGLLSFDCRVRGGIRTIFRI